MHRFSGRHGISSRHVSNCLHLSAGSHQATACELLRRLSTGGSQILPKWGRWPPQNVLSIINLVCWFRSRAGSQLTSHFDVCRYLASFIPEYGLKASNEQTNAGWQAPSRTMMARGFDHFNSNDCYMWREARDHTFMSGFSLSLGLTLKKLRGCVAPVLKEGSTAAAHESDE